MERPRAEECARDSSCRTTEVALAPPHDIRRSEVRVGAEEFVVLSYPLPSLNLPTSLTAAEREVAIAMLAGLTNEQISANRGSAVRTVANQAAAIFRKTGVHSRLELGARLLHGSGQRKLHRHDEVWNRLVAGRWTLVDRFDCDGRRFLVARSNVSRGNVARDNDVARGDDAIAQSPPCGLSPRERQVLRYRGLGCSLKLISFELGLSIATVSEELARAMEKLGIRSNCEIIEIVRLGV